jgi:hypothetical protein
LDVAFSAGERFVAMTALRWVQHRRLGRIQAPYVGVWSTSDGGRIVEIDAVRCLGFSPDGNQVAVHRWENPDIQTEDPVGDRQVGNGVAVVDVRSGNLLTRVTSAWWAGTETRLCRLTSNWDVLVVKDLDGSVSLLSFPDGHLLRRYAGAGTQAAPRVKEFLTIPVDGQRAVWWSTGGEAQVFGITADAVGSRFTIFERDHNNTRATYVAPDGRSLAVLG